MNVFICFTAFDRQLTIHYMSYLITGDFGFDPMGQLKGKSEKQVNELKLKELKNGRLAMIAIMGMFVQNLAFPGVPTLSF